MKLALPPLDAHAHVEPAVAAEDLEGLGCVVFAVTRMAQEWPTVARRKDSMTVWGIGCHPGYSAEVAAFSADAFCDAIYQMPLVGEVGLDARSPAPMKAQDRVFRSVLEITAERPRLLSIHSVGASSKVLDAIEERPQQGVILHWWRGSAAETERALELGCFFSLNGAEVRRPKVLALLPKDRVLTETDYPFTEKFDRAANRPGSVSTIEVALERAWKTDRWGVRKQIWLNLKRLCVATGCADAVPTGVARVLLSVASG